MGHRTLVAYDRDGYDLHYAHWGVDPADITPETPFGGPPEGGWARERATDIVDPAGGRLDDDALVAGRQPLRLAAPEDRKSVV